MSTFTGAEDRWMGRLGVTRNVVRQHVIAQQLDAHLDGVRTVLDVGCGQGTQAIQLASKGLAVTGVDPSEELLGLLDDDARRAGVHVRTLRGGIDLLGDLLADETFDLVCVHGVLMYLSDALAGLQQVLPCVGPRGRLSFTVRNGDALAYRPGIRGRWAEARSAFEAATYVNELGVPAHAHRLQETLGWCVALGIELEEWYGVRVLTDGLAADAEPEPATLEDCLAAEVEAGRRDPYRHFGSMLHVVGRRDETLD